MLKQHRHVKCSEPFGWSLTSNRYGSLSHELFSDYRNAFAEFAQKIRQARALMSATNPDWQAIDAALLDLEKARVNYNHQRDMLAQQLLSSSQLPGQRPSLSRTG